MYTNIWIIWYLPLADVAPKVAWQHSSVVKMLLKRSLHPSCVFPKIQNSQFFCCLHIIF